MCRPSIRLRELDFAVQVVNMGSTNPDAHRLQDSLHIEWAGDYTLHRGREARQGGTSGTDQPEPAAGAPYLYPAAALQQPQVTAQAASRKRRNDGDTGLTTCQSRARRQLATAEGVVGYVAVKTYIPVYLADSIMREGTETGAAAHTVPELVLPGERLAEHLPHGLRLMSRKGRLSAVAPSMDSPLARDAIMAHVQPAAGAAPSQLPADVHSQSRLVNGTDIFSTGYGGPSTAVAGASFKGFDNTVQPDDLGISSDFWGQQDMREDNLQQHWSAAGDLGREYGLSAANANLEDLSATGQVNGLHNNDEHLEHQPTFKEPYDAHGESEMQVKPSAYDHSLGSAGPAMKLAPLDLSFLDLPEHDFSQLCSHAASGFPAQPYAAQEEARGPMAPSDMACTPAITGNAGEVSAPDGVNPNVEQAMFDTTVAPDFSPGTHAAVPTAAQPPPEGTRTEIAFTPTNLEQDQQTDEPSTAFSSSSSDLGDHLEDTDIDGHEGGQVDLQQLGSLEGRRATHNYYVDTFTNGHDLKILTDEEVETGEAYSFLVGGTLQAECQKEATDDV